MKLVAVAVLAMVGCIDDSGPVIELGVLQTREPLEIDIPASLIAGTPFVVTITTYGGGCDAREPDRTDVELAADAADISVFDRRQPSGGGVCLADLLVFFHEATLTFDEPGPKTLRIHGRRKIVDDVEIVVEIPIDVTAGIN